MSGLGPGWTQEAYRELFGLPQAEAKEIWDATKELTIPRISALYVCFGATNFIRGPIVLCGECWADLELDEILTIAVMTRR